MILWLQFTWFHSKVNVVNHVITEKWDPSSALETPQSSTPTEGLRYDDDRM